MLFNDDASRRRGIFKLLMIAYALLFAISIFLLETNDVRPVIYYIVMAIIATLVLLQILQKQSRATVMLILLQVMLLMVNLIWGVTLKYYFFFGANDVHRGEIGGIGVAVADKPEGPYKDLLGKPLINDIVNGAQPIDQFVFRDRDGSYYMYYGGWKHCNMVKLKDDFSGITPSASSVATRSSEQRPHSRTPRGAMGWAGAHDDVLPP